jgi:rhamnosyltransferase
MSQHASSEGVKQRITLVDPLPECYISNPSAVQMRIRRFDQVVAILVLFNPNIDPTGMVSRLAECVGKLVVVDNTLEGHSFGRGLVPAERIVYLRNENRGGLAGAYNRALRYLEANLLEWSEVVFVDDDSDVSILSELLADEVTRDALAQRETAAVSAVYRDRSSGLRGSYTQLRRFGFSYLPRGQRGLTPVAFLINSMSVWRRAALQTIGPFNETLQVDRVDTDYCLRASRAGLSTFINGNHEFAHSIGHRTSYTFLGATLQSSGHTARRRFLIARNTIWIARKYMRNWPALLPLSILWIGYEVMGILIAENEKRKKLGAVARGIGHGLVMRMSVSA